MWRDGEGKITRYLLGVFCFYLLYFAAAVFYLDMDRRWIFVPAASFIVSLPVLGRHRDRAEAYTFSVLACVNIAAYGVMLQEFTEVFTIFCAAVCLLSFYHHLKVNYLMLGFFTAYIVYGLAWQGEWQRFLERDGALAVSIRILSVYLVQVLLIMLIRRQQAAQSLAEQKALEAEMAARAKEDFLVNMSHEIRTPMNAITGMAELALRSGALPEPEKGYLQSIHAAGEDLATIIDDILDITKIDSGSLEIREEEYEITAIIHDVVNVVQIILGQKEVVLLVDVNPDTPVRLRGDRVRVKQILLNLLNNAAKNTEKGTIHLTVKPLPVDGDSGHVDLCVSVADTGIGMSENQLEDLFTKFRQADAGNRAQGGNGLGLAVSKRLVELMHGTLVAKSEPGKGSEFTFTVRQEVVDAGPCLEADPQPAQQQPSEEDVQDPESVRREGGRTTFTAPTARILLVDDNKVNLKVAEGLLRPYKMCVETATSGAQAIEMVKNRIYDLIFMDHMMPQMDGVEATAIIRSLDGERFRTMPIIALSANALRGAREMFLDAGMDDFVAKPIEMRMMDETMR
ncbi:MAG: ATP-binding protein, partial [Muribaculaceae bacterium]|nr:ATP-binding protein [Muribaculaceae bacterium]